MSLSEKLLQVFCDVDDFCQIFLPLWQLSLLQVGHIKRVREPKLSISEIMSLIIHFEHSRHRSPINCMVNLLAGLVAYTHQEHKPALNLADFGIDPHTSPLLA